MGRVSPALDYLSLYAQKRQSSGILRGVTSLPFFAFLYIAYTKLLFKTSIEDNMGELKVDVWAQTAKNSRKVKFHPNKYPFSSKFRAYCQLRGVKTSTVYHTLKSHGIPENTIKTFLSGSHIPNSRLSHLVEAIWSIHFDYTDFEE